MSARERSPLPALDPLRTVPIVLIALFIVLAAVDLLLALQPALLRSLRSSWENMAPVGRTGSPLPTLLAATAAISGIALSATLVAAFIRAVRRAPFTWLTPSLIGLWSVLISGVNPLPLPISTALFAGASALLLAGGGVLLQQPVKGRAWLGGLLLLTPLALLLAAYQARGAGLDRDAKILLISQIAISFAVLGVARVTRSRIDPVRAEAAAAALAEEERQPAPRHDDPRLNGLETRLRDALITVASSETRALQAEQRARGAEQRAQDAEQRAQGVVAEPALHTVEGDGPGVTRSRASTATFIWLSLLWIGACGAVSYFSLYAPMQKRLLAQQGLIRRSAEQREREISALQARFEQERSTSGKQRDELNTQLEQLRQQQSAPPPAKASASHAADSSASSSSERAGGWRARRLQRLQEAAEAASASEAATPNASSSDSESPESEPAPARRSGAHSNSARSESSEPESAPTRRSSSSRGDDDPIGGLDL